MFKFIRKLCKEVGEVPGVIYSSMNPVYSKTFTIAYLSTGIIMTFVVLPCLVVALGGLPGVGVAAAVMFVFGYVFFIWGKRFLPKQIKEEEGVL